jgi:hypothetical protein
MSVWDEAVYRDNAFQSLARVGGKPFLLSEVSSRFLDFTVEEFGDFPVPNGVVTGNLMEVAKDNYLLRASLYPSLPGTGHKGFIKVLENTDKIKFGLKAVWDFYARYCAKPRIRSEYPSARKRFVETIFIYGGAASYKTRKDYEQYSGFLSAAFEKHIIPAETIFRAILKAPSAARRAHHKFEERLSRDGDVPLPPLQGKDVRIAQNLAVYHYRGVWVYLDELNNLAYVFTRADIARLKQLIYGFANALYYADALDMGYSELGRKMEFACERMKSLCIQASGKCNSNRINDLCRAFDILYHTYLSKLASDIDHRAVELHEKKLREEKVAEIVNIAEYNSILSGLKPKEALEVALIFKCFPQPDFDYFGACYRQMELYKGYNALGDEISVEAEAHFQNVLLYYKYLMVRAFHGRHGYCPGRVQEDALNEEWAVRYPNIDPAEFEYKKVAKIDLHGAFQFVEFGEDNLDLVKDKAICPMAVNELKTAEDKRKVKIESKNMLMNVLNRAYPVDLHELDKNRGSLFYDLLAEDKAEAKKRNGRQFFEAHTDVRMLQSQYELSISEYARFAPAFIANKTLKEKKEMFNETTALAPDHAPDTGLLISFDLAKWSPHMNPRIHVELDNINADLFGRDSLRMAHRLFSYGKIHYIKGAIHHSYRKMGVDFEGFAGKKLTMFHCAVMGYSVRMMRERRITQKGAKFMALIDDGLLRVAVKKETLKRDKERVIGVLEEIYTAVGLELSWDKTYISERFAIFLNDVKLYGTSINPAMRAVVKMNAEKQFTCPTILDELGDIASRASGVITAGGLPTIVYALYCYYVSDIFSKWSQRKTSFSPQLAVVAFAPIGLGGFAIETPLTLSGSVRSVPLSECISHMKAIGTRYASTRSFVNFLVNQPIRTLDTLDKIRNPGLVRREGRTIRSNRAENLIAKYLMMRVDAPSMAPILGVASKNSVMDAAVMLGDLASVPATVLKLVWESTIDFAVAQVAAKFLKSSTASSLVPQKALYRRFLSNKTEAQALIREWDIR